MKKRKMIHYSMVLFPLMIVFTMIMTFTAKNNFTADFDNQIGVMDADTIPKADVIDMVQKKLIIPFKKLRLEQLGETPECFEHKFYFNYGYEEEAQLPFYKGQMVGGRVVETDCYNEYHLYSVKIYFDDNKILVQNSVFDEWTDPKTYLNNFRLNINI